MKLKSLPAYISSFQVIGISVRTSNREGKAKKDIGELFSKFMSGNMIEKIPVKKSHDIYCIYTDYESDFNGPYSTIIGCSVENLENIPEGFTGITIPASNYQVFKATGKLSEAVGNSWVQIWESGMERKYAADFDVYGLAATNPEDAVVDIFVSVA